MVADRVRFLGLSTKVVDRVLAECNDTKSLSPFNIWVFGLLAKSAQSGRAVVSLVSSRRTLDASLVGRSILDSAIDISYLLDGPLGIDRLNRLLSIEAAHDEFDEFKDYCRRIKKTTKSVVGVHPWAQQVVYRHRRARYDWITRGKSCASPGEKRWRNMSLNEKIGPLATRVKQFRLFQDPMRRLGDAAAHSRPLAFKEFLHVDATGAGVIRVSQKASGQRNRPSQLAFEVGVYILIASSAIVEHYALSSRHERAIVQLLDSVRRKKANVADR